MDSTTTPPTDAGDFDIRPFLSAAGALAGLANVVMQLARPPVGYGVKESRVTAGSAMLHPLKRTRTTFTYLAVALLGTDDDRRRYRRAVNRQHAQVRSTATSPVEYNAFDPELQLWIAACLYYGLADVLGRVREPPDDQTSEALYRYCARLGTSLQVHAGMWPADREEFGRYWERSVSELSIDDPVREYLRGLVDLRNLPRVLSLAFRGTSRFWTTGFLPPELRDQMGLPWGAARQARFEDLLRLIGSLESVVPVPLRALPLSLLLWDTRLRHRLGLPLV